MSKKDAAGNSILAHPYWCSVLALATRAALLFAASSCWDLFGAVSDTIRVAGEGVKGPVPTWTAG